MLQQFDNKNSYLAQKMENFFKHSQTFALSQSIEYSNNAIVSKTIVKNTAGSITLFAFDTNQSLSEHTAPFDAIVYVIEGTAEIQIGGNIIACKAGEMIIMPANIPHSLRAIDKLKMLLTMLKA